MDMITIWLQRVGGHPIQVFTGYLDSVPYYQAYPGNCTLQATCTLKKIAVTWFDPGLTFYQNIVNDLGWAINPNTGDAEPTLPSQRKVTGSDPTKAINDGGFAQLLYEFMVQICNWNPGNVYISNLPPTLPRKAAELYRKISTATEEDLTALENDLRQIMGITFASDTTTANGTLKKPLEKAITEVRRQGSNYNVNLLVLITAAQLLTGVDPKFHQHYSQDPQGWGYGLFAARPPLTHKTEGGQTTYQEGTTIDGHPIRDFMDPTLATELFCRRLLSSDKSTGRAVVGPLQSKANQGNAAAIRTWIQHATGRTFGVGTFDSAITSAQALVKTFDTSSNTHNSTTVINSTVLGQKHLGWNDDEITSLMSSVEANVFTREYQGKIHNELAPYYYFAKKNHAQVELCKRWTSDPSILLLSFSKGSSGFMPLNQVFDSFKGKTQPSLIIRNVAFSSSGVTEPPAFLVHGKTSNGTAVAKRLLADMPTNSVLIQVPKGASYPTWDGQPPPTNQTLGVQKNPDPSAQQSIQNNGLNFQDLGKLSLAAAFTSQFAIPVNYIESQRLTGEKALLNDISCLDAVGQFCAASMRTFMSLPNGKFLAFYPDYFGAHGRKPYWQIFDIEMLNMGIQLNDTSLATHVYVVGDTFGFGDQSEGMQAFNAIDTRGVATLTQASILESLIVPINHHKFGGNQKESAWGRLKDAYAFLNHYGARPFTQQEPLIRNTFYEFLYAWQTFEQKWAQTFNTEVLFTFQPEVMAGGIIEFPQHNLQMYVESVTHTWDYTEGFFTQAVLSSPAAVKDNGLGVAGLPGFALAGGVNSVGVGL